MVSFNLCSFHSSFVCFAFIFCFLMQIWSIFRNIFSKYFSHLWRAQVILSIRLIFLQFLFSFFLFVFVAFDCCAFLLLLFKWIVTVLFRPVYSENKKRTSTLIRCKWYNILIITISPPQVWRVWKIWIRSSIISAWTRTGDHFSIHIGGYM